jgi:hypothetical protein
MNRVRFASRLVSSTLAVALLLSLTLEASARSAPMEEQDMMAYADLVIEGTVTKVEKVDKAYKSHCSKWQDYHATLVVDAVHKGPSPKTVVVRYQSRVKSLEDCSCPPVSYAWKSGERYKLFLQMRKDAPGTYGFVDWAGVIELPKSYLAQRALP